MPKVQPQSASLIVEAVASVVKNIMEKYDCSHDWQHIQRVRKLALKLAHSFEPGHVKLFEVELAALMHDLNDCKYSNVVDIPNLLKSSGLSDETVIEEILFIIDNVSYSKEVKNIKSGTVVPITKELACVRDADRLDALGAIGIARCCAFGGIKSRRLYSLEDFEGAPNTTAEHFYEKLLRLKNMMCTDLGKKIAQERTGIMETFINEMRREVFED
jgi:uncharacterized protein